MNTTTQGTRVNKGKDVVLSLVFGGIITLLFVSGLVYMMNQSGQSNTNYTKAYASGPSNTAPVTTNAAIALNSGTTATYGLAANVSDVDSNLDLASYDLDPVTAGQQTSIVVSGKGTFSIAIGGTSQLTFVRDVGFTTGSAVINYTIADTLAAVSNSSTITVNVAIGDTTLPIVSLASSSLSVITSSAITLTATATDNIGVTKVEIYDNITPAVPYATLLSSPYVVVGPVLTSANNGSYIYTAKAYDAAGNIGVSSTVTVVVNIPVVTGDTTPPVVTAKTATTPASTPVAINALTGATDNVGGSGVNPASVVITTPVGATFVANSSGIITVTPTCSAPCAATANFTVKDASGNISNSATITVSVTAVSDSDGDSISNTTEDAGPNNGDANGDGTKDSLQPLVASIPTLSSSKYLSVQISNGVGPNCSKITQTQIQNLAGLVVNTDGSYSYPYGLLQLDLPCTQADITVDWYVGDTKDIKYRKLVYTTPGVTSTATYNDYTSSITKFTRYGITGYRAQFTLKDGQVGDLTTVDGRILDPSGIADTATVAAPALPRTGLVGFGIFSSILLLFVAGVTLYNAAAHSGSFRKINY
jgi:hypothetical protein